MHIADTLLANEYDPTPSVLRTHVHRQELRGECRSRSQAADACRSDQGSSSFPSLLPFLIPGQSFARTTFRTWLASQGRCIGQASDVAHHSDVPAVKFPLNLA